MEAASAITPWGPAPTPKKSSPAHVARHCNRMQSTERTISTEEATRSARKQHAPTTPTQIYSSWPARKTTIVWVSLGVPMICARTKWGKEHLATAILAPVDIWLHVAVLWRRQGKAEGRKGVSDTGS